MQITVNAIITHNNKVLLVKKRATSGRPKAIWELPGGPLTAKNISIEHAAISAIESELGVAIFTTGRWFNNTYKNHVTIVLSAALCDERDAYTLHPSKAVIELKWVHQSDLYHADITPLARDRILNVLAGILEVVISK